MIAPPRLFVLTGAAESGKDDLINAVRLLAVGEMEVEPKHTSRPRRPSDGPEVVCQGEPGNLLECCEVQYERSGSRYGISSSSIWGGLHRGQFQVIAVADVAALLQLRQTFGDLMVGVYVHSEPDAEAR